MKLEMVNARHILLPVVDLPTCMRFG